MGRDALLIEVADAREAVALTTWLRGRAEAGEVVPGAATVLVREPADRAALLRTVADWTPPEHVAPTRTVEVPVVLDGADLADVARAWDTDVDGVAARVADLRLTSAFCGFAPGFAYLAGLPARLALPRLASPRPRVPAGSLAIGGGWVGLYPTASPGGWRLLGRTDVVLFDVDRDPPALLAPGTRVRLVPR